MEAKVKREAILSSLVWKLMERGGVQGVSFIVSLILARLLTPRDYGLISLIIIFINLSNVFIQGGFNTALIQKKDTSDEDFSSVFYFSLFFAIILYIILFFSAPLIAAFFKETVLVDVVRILSITLFFGAVNSVQTAFISRNMQYKKLFVSSIGAIVFSAIIGIYMAVKGFGVWALVWQQLSCQFCSILIMFFTVSWKPKLTISFERLKSLISYGWKILATNLSSTLFVNLRSLIIGKLYTSSMLGYFNRGRQFPEIIMNNINTSVQSVMLVAYSYEQDNRDRIKAMVKRTMTVNSFTIFPLMFGLAVISEPVVKLLLTDKWLPAVPFIQIYCFTYMIMPIHTANLEAIKAMGYSNIILKLDIIRKVFELSILIISVNFGILVIAIGELITTFISLGINLYPNKKLINYGIREQLKDVLPSFVISMIMAIAVYCLHYLQINMLVMVVIQIFLGATIYILLARITKNPTLKYLYDLSVDYFRKNLSARN